MRGAGIGVLVIGIIIALAGLANHYVMHANPLGGHTSTVIGAVGAVVAVVGLVMLMMGGRSASAS